MPDRPEIVCLCGSIRFVEELRAASREIAYTRATGKPVSFTDPAGPPRRAGAGR